MTPDTAERASGVSMEGMRMGERGRGSVRSTVRVEPMIALSTISGPHTNSAPYSKATHNYPVSLESGRGRKVGRMRGRFT